MGKLSGEATIAPVSVSDKKIKLLPTMCFKVLAFCWATKALKKKVCVSQRVCGTWMRTKWQSYFFVMQNLFLHSDFICYKKHTFYLREFNVKKTSNSLFRHICSASIYSSPWTLKSCIVLQLWITLDSLNFFHCFADENIMPKKLF